MNRALRRKQIKAIAANVVKGRAAATKKRQIGFGFVITSHMVTIMFWRWAWTPFDRRGR